MSQILKPIPQKLVVGILILISVLTSLAAGYFSSVLDLEKKKYARIEDMYVRVRDVLGRDLTQEIIDFSHQENYQQIEAI